jgi:hypothetical protein
MIFERVSIVILQNNVLDLHCRGSVLKMDRYTRVEKAREETPIKENEIRIMTQGRMRNYITYAINLLQVTSDFFFQTKKLWDLFYCSVSWR